MSPKKWLTPTWHAMTVTHCNLLIDAKVFNSRLNIFQCGLVTPCSAKIVGKLKPHVIMLKRDGICKPLLRPDVQAGRDGGEGRLSSRTISAAKGSAASVGTGGIGSMRVAIAAGGGSS